MKLSDLKPAPYNPRTISQEAMHGLSTSIGEFGDISGIVFNARTGHLVTGHQRVKALTAKHGDLELVDGFIVTPDGERFRVRVVEWDEMREKAANVAANSHLIGGEFTEDLAPLLEEIDEALPDLAEDLRFEELGEEYDFDDNASDGNGRKGKNQSPEEKWAILVEVKDEQEQVELLERFMEEGLKCRGLIL